MTATVGHTGDAADGEIRPLDELRSSGLLWLVNRVVFHPRGFALALNLNDDGNVDGWQLVGDGTEVWSYAPDVDEDALMAAATFTLQQAPL